MVDRRAVLRASGTALAGTLAGCSLWSRSAPESYETVTPAGVPDVPEDRTTTTVPDPDPELTVAHWFDRRDRLAGYQALVDNFRIHNPDVPVRGTRDDGDRPGDDDRTRRDGSAPSSVRQANAGGGLDSMVRNERVLDIEASVWGATGLKDRYPADVAALAGPGDAYVAVPLSGERLNNLFFNRSVVERAGVDPTALSGIADLRQALSTIDSETDATPLALPMARPWQVGGLLESIVIAEAGPERYRRLAAGEIDTAERQALRDGLATIADLRPYVPDDAAEIRREQAVERVASGQAAMTVGADRMVGGPAVETGFDEQTGRDGGQKWGHTPIPGTDGFVLMTVTAFVAPAENPTPEWARTWLRFCGEGVAQRQFSIEAGTIPLRTDMRANAMAPYQIGQFDDYLDAAARLPSFTYGLAVDDRPYASLIRQLYDFIEYGDVEVTANRIAIALQR